MNRKTLLFLAFSGGSVIVLVLWLGYIIGGGVSQHHSTSLGSDSTNEVISDNKAYDTFASDGIAFENESPEPVDSKQVGPAEQELLRNEILDVIGSDWHPASCNYEKVISTLDRSSVSLLRKMLRDESYRNNWAQISHMIAWLSDKHDRESFSAIFSYIRRPDTWSASEVRAPEIHLSWKARAVGTLGLFKIDGATEVLQTALTQKGAEELVGAWVNLPHDMSEYDPGRFIALVRGHAASGLVMSGNENNITLVIGMYEEHTHRPLSRGSDMMLYYKLVDAMVERDVINEMGLEGYLRARGSESESSLKRSYFEKYLGEMMSNGSYVVDPCPICGKSPE